MTVWSIDPGEKIGFASWRDDGDLRYNDTLSVDRMMEVLAGASNLPHTVVMEDWRLRGHRAMQQTGSRMLASQVIGMVRLFCFAHETKLVYQEPQVMQLAAMHQGIKYPKGHVPDALAAKLHGLYYFESVDLLSPVSLEDRLSLGDGPGTGF